MKVLHLAGGGDIGGAKTHILSLVKEISKVNQVKLVSFRYGDFAESAKNIGIDVFETSSKLIFKDVKELFKVYDEFKPDIVHCHGAKANFMGLMLKKYKKACVTSTIHSDYRKDYIHNIFKLVSIGIFNTFALRIINYHIAVTEEFARTLISRGFNPHNMFSIYNCIDFDKKLDIIPKEDYFKQYHIPYNPEEVIIGIAARLTKVKDISTLIKGFAKSYEENKNIRLLIAGDGEEKNMLSSLAKKLGVSDRVHFLGWISNIDAFFSVIDIDVISSLSETFPYSLTEGIRAGAIPISSLVGGAPSLIDHKVTGYIFEPRDYKALGKYISELASDKEKRETMQKEIYKRTKKNFSLDAMRNLQLSIYDLILKRFRSDKRNMVVICGAYGRGNAGDEAIKHATLSGIRSIDSDMELCVMTLRPRKERAIDRVNTIFTFNIFKLYFILKRTKLFVSGGGSLIQDITSTRSLLFYIYTLYMAKKANCKVIMFGCGIGPLTRPINRKLAGRVIDNYVDVITVRDHLSKKELDSLGVIKPKIFVTADPAINLVAKLEDRHKIFIEENIPMEGKYICLALRNWKKFNRHKEIADACKKLYEKYDLIPIFFPMEYPKDLSASQKVIDLLDIPYFVIENRYPIEQAIGFISQMDMVLAMRLHALIFAAANYVPVIGVSYDVKVSGFMEYIENESCIELDNVEVQTIVDAATKSFELKNKVIEATNILKEKEEINKIQMKKLIEP